MKNTGTVALEPLVLEGAVEIGNVPLRRYAPFYDPLVKFSVDEGLLDLATKYRYAAGPKGNTTLSDLTATLRSPSLRKRTEKKPFFRAPSVALTATSLDLAKRDLRAGELASAGGFLAVVRDKEGNTDVTRLMAEPPPGARPEPHRPPGPSPCEGSPSIGTRCVSRTRRRTGSPGIR
jgi:hypothetical protein